MSASCSTLTDGDASATSAGGNAGTAAVVTEASNSPTSPAATEPLPTEPPPEPTTTAPTTIPIPPDELPWPTDAATAAVALSEAERQLRAIDDPTEIAQWGRRQQQLYQVLSTNREWADDAVSLVDESVRPAVELNWLARQELSALVKSGPLSETLPAWRIKDPLPIEELLGYYKEAEAATGVPWTYVAAINLVETRMGRIEGYSTAGALGPMQFLPSTWESCCTGDPTIARDAILGSATYLTLVGAPNDMAAALWGYNHSDRYVAAVTAYAEVMQKDESAYAGYHAWEVYFSSAVGVLKLDAGYEQPEPISAADWLASHPDDLLGP